MWLLRVYRHRKFASRRLKAVSAGLQWQIRHVTFILLYVPFHIPLRLSLWVSLSLTVCLAVSVCPSSLVVGDKVQTVGAVARRLCTVLTRPNPSDMRRIGRQKTHIITRRPAAGEGGGWFLGAAVGRRKIWNEARRRHSVTDLGDGIVTDLRTTAYESRGRSA